MSRFLVSKRRDEHLFHAEEEALRIIETLQSVRWDLYVAQNFQYGTQRSAIVRLRKAIESAKFVEAGLKVVIEEMERG
jgi:hypothetical protein